MAAFHNNGSCLDFKKQTQIVALCLWSDIFDFVWYCCVTVCYYSISLVGVVNLCCCFGLNQWKVSINIIHTSILSCFSCCLCCQLLKTHLVAGNYKKSSHAAWKENVFLVSVQADLWTFERSVLHPHSVYASFACVTPCHLPRPRINVSQINTVITGERASVQLVSGPSTVADNSD